MRRRAAGGGTEGSSLPGGCSQPLPSSRGAVLPSPLIHRPPLSEQIALGTILPPPSPCQACLCQAGSGWGGAGGTQTCAGAKARGHPQHPGQLGGAGSCWTTGSPGFSLPGGLLPAAPPGPSAHAAIACSSMTRCIKLCVLLAPAVPGHHPVPAAAAPALSLCCQWHDYGDSTETAAPVP